jgi:hypothetical protein
VHATDESSLDLWLCDFGGSRCDELEFNVHFGGSRCDELGFNVHHLPDEPFCDPWMLWESTPATDIFSLGSVIYTTLTGYWPYREDLPPVTIEDKFAYESYVNKMFKAGIFLDVSKLRGGKMIKSCWDHQYKTADQVLCAIMSEMVTLDRSINERFPKS